MLPSHPHPASFARRRHALLRTLAAHPLTLASNGAPAAILFATGHAHRNGDVEHSYRASSDLAYLTGFREPACALVLLPGRPEGEAVLFVQPSDKDAERWNGKRLGVERARAILDVDARSMDEFATQLPALLAGRRSLWVRNEHAMDARVHEAIATTRTRARRRGAWPVALCDLALALDPMRLLKDDDELHALARAAEISCAAHVAAMRACGPGKNERDLVGELLHTFLRSGGGEPGYTPIVAGGDHACTLHYVDNDAPLKDGELVLIDAGCEFDLYTADITRTFPVNGRFTRAQRDVVDIVVAANLAAIDAARVGRTFRDVDDTARRVLAQGLVDLQVLSGSIDTLVTKVPFDGMPAHSPGRAPLDAFYMHGTSHWLGLDVHDVGAYHDGEHATPLEPRMVLTVEPGLYFDSDDARVPERLRGIGVRIEDDVVVTDGAPRVLTEGVPKSPDAIESLMAR